jgi:hypothetical protein
MWSAVDDLSCRGALRRLALGTTLGRNLVPIHEHFQDEYIWLTFRPTYQQGKTPS